MIIRNDLNQWWFNHFPLPRPLPIYRTASQWNCQTQVRLLQRRGLPSFDAIHMQKQNLPISFLRKQRFPPASQPDWNCGQRALGSNQCGGSPIFNPFSIDVLPLSIFDWYTIEILFQIFPACQRSSPPQHGPRSSSCSGPCILSWTLKQRLFMTTQLTKVCFL